jgi:hypothetical protein
MSFDCAITAQLVGWPVQAHLDQGSNPTPGGRKAKSSTDQTIVLLRGA